MLRLKNSISLQEWKETAKKLILHKHHYSIVTWLPIDQMELSFMTDEMNLYHDRDDPKQFKVPKEFHDLAKNLSMHRDPSKWDVLYRLLWKIKYDDRHILSSGLDPDHILANRMIKSIRRDLHKMKAFVRFQEYPHPIVENETLFVSWFEPEHRIVKEIAPFFSKRFTNMHWSILTPDDCVHWNQKELLFSPGMNKPKHFQSDEFESLWKDYYKSTFNPNRLKIKAMLSEMPMKYWKNLPEAELIPDLIQKGQDIQKR